MPIKKVIKKAPIAAKKAAKKAVKKVLPSKVKAADITLMEKPSVICKDIRKYKWLIYGERKIGKTTLLNQFPGAYFFMFDPLNHGLALRQTYIPDWSYFLVALDVLEQKIKANPNFCKMLILDTGFMCYERLFQHVNAEYGIADPQDKSWGTVWKDIFRQFIEIHDRIFSMGIGFGVTAHSELISVKRRNGESYDKLTTQLGKQAFKYYIGMSDVIGYYHYDVYERRQLAIAGDSLVEAGTRIDEHFMYSNGEPMRTIPMGKSASEGYKNLNLAFNNKFRQPKPKGGKVIKKK